jgi:hypothetical protein
VLITGVDFNTVTGTHISQSGSTVTAWGNVGNATDTNIMDGVSAVTCAAGSPTASFTVTNGVVTHC